MSNLLFISHFRIYLVNAYLYHKIEVDIFIQLGLPFICLLTWFLSHDIINLLIDMMQQLVLKIQLPAVFSAESEVDLQLIWYKFDPDGQLKQQGEKDHIYHEINVGEILKIMLEQQRKSLKIYGDQNWKNILRPITPFAFELQLKVKVKNINTPSLKIKNIQEKLRPNLYQTLQIKSVQTITENSLAQQINSIAKILLKKTFKKSSQIINNSISLAPQKLYNPHLFIKTANKQKHIQYYTKGIYEYYHYGDQSFSDHGWGCAYRSLQTLLSWLNLQNHIKLPKMPSITQIQDIIDRINLGSKDKLKNSNGWIGAIQVSWVVKKLTNYDCRILHISDGKNIMEQCQVLRQHFEKAGCPVMYGGGEYAYSIVGLNYAWELGECEFLILDPHYTGTDNLEKVFQKKGLCWRKPDEMFKKDIFYNFCLPNIPPN